MKPQQHIRRAITETLESRLLLADASVVKDILAGPDSSVFFNQNSKEYAVNGGKIFFTAIDPTLDRQPYVSNGTRDGTHRVRTTGINTGGDTQIGEYVAAPDSSRKLVFFAANDGNGWDVWATDGTDAETSKITNLGALTGSTGVNYMTYVDGELYFTADGKLYKTSYTDGGQELVTSTAVPLPNQLAVGNTLFFEAEDAANGGELWAHSASQPAHLVANINPGDADSTIRDLTSFNNKLYFTAFDGNGGTQVFQSNGQTATRVGAALPSDAFPFGLTVSGGNLYFVAKTGGGYQIWRSDGTNKSRITSLGGTSDFNAIRDLTDVNGTLYFSYATNGSNRLLYKLVGDEPTRVGTATGGPGGGTSPGHLAAIGSTLYFSGLDLNGTAKLFSTDGSSIALVTGDTGTDPAGLVNVGGKLFFRADDSSKGTELRVLGDVVPAPSGVNVKLKITTPSAIEGSDDFYVYEGKPVTFYAVPSPLNAKGLTYKWNFDDGSSKFVPNGRKPTYTYADGLESAVAKRVRVKIFLNGLPIDEDSITVRVLNAAPRVKLDAPSLWPTLWPLSVTVRATDEGTKDTLTGLMDWGDNTTQPFAITNGGKVTLKHAYLFAPTGQTPGYTMWAYVTDKDNRKSEFKHTVLMDSAVSVIGDKASGIVKGVLAGGTKNNDRIRVQPVAPEPHGMIRRDVGDDDPREDVEVFLNGTSQGIFSLGSLDTLQIQGGEGNDRIEIDPAITSRIHIFGGEGNDTIFGGNGDDTLYGNQGRDKLYGRGGKNKVKQ